MIPFDVALVEALVAEWFPQWFPQWARLPVRPVLPGGHDNRTFRLGEHLAVRLPSAEAYVAAVAKEQRWLPRLAPLLPVPIPEPLAQGRPAAGYPWPWSVNRWLPGEPTTTAPIPDPAAFVREVAAFLSALRAAPADGGPAAGAHSFHRGGELAIYAEEAARAATRLPERDRAWAARVLDAALASRWHGPPVWVHGDVAVGNLLVDRGRLAGVIDFGSSAVGDPACDFVLAWTWCDAATARAFRTAVGLDAATWRRAAGWALWKALITLDDPRSERTLARLREDFP